MFLSVPQVHTRVHMLSELLTTFAGGERGRREERGGRRERKEGGERGRRERGKEEKRRERLEGTTPAAVACGNL